MLDGEIVALDAKGEPAGFQQLQGRIHRRRQPSRTTAPSRRPARPAVQPPTSRSSPSTCCATATRSARPAARRAARGARARSSATARGVAAILRISELVRGDGRALYARALASGWEGLIAKRADSRYQLRQADARLAQAEDRPRAGVRRRRLDRTAQHAVALRRAAPRRATSRRRTRAAEATRPANPLSDRPDLRRPHRHRLQRARARAADEAAEAARNAAACPFASVPPVERAAALGAGRRWSRRSSSPSGPTTARCAIRCISGCATTRKPQDVVVRETDAHERRIRERQASRQTPRLEAGNAANASARAARALRPPATSSTSSTRIEARARDGVLDAARRRPAQGHQPAQGVLAEAEAHQGRSASATTSQVAPFLLPGGRRSAAGDEALSERRRRHSRSISTRAQRRADGRARRDRSAGRHASAEPQIIGGDLTTLLYMTQLAAISQDPVVLARAVARRRRLRRARSRSAGRRAVRARARRRALDPRRARRARRRSAFPKTSGADGLHIYIPLPPGTPYEAGLLFCQIVATVVAQKHPKAATVERSVDARGTRVYVDYLQNIHGKTLATRLQRAGQRLRRRVDAADVEGDRRGRAREDFTIQTVPARLEKVGDLWAALRTSKGVDLSRVSRYARRAVNVPKNVPRRRSDCRAATLTFGHGVCSLERTMPAETQENRPETTRPRPNPPTEKRPPAHPEDKEHEGAAKTKSRQPRHRAAPVPTMNPDRDRAHE